LVFRRLSDSLQPPLQRWLPGFQWVICWYVSVSQSQENLSQRHRDHREIRDSTDGVPYFFLIGPTCVFQFHHRSIRNAVSRYISTRHCKKITNLCELCDSVRDIFFVHFHCIEVIRFLRRDYLELRAELKKIVTVSGCPASASGSGASRVSGRGFWLRPWGRQCASGFFPRP